ncbi:hypothetical protein FB45DRAFT_891675 [Roridomyces roridus]|uniref:DUF6534 domain-containing protein n=1 Tax=Roridomyces roridus TaxID=1738132 RepID=A0AAD7CEN9_9AGAR|nr:hypothetical protein FB45DRAFT_891675 [Roridomyces roridus]
MSALPDGVDISSKADAMFVGVMLAPVLSGITISQSWTYYNSNKDGWMLRSFVGLLVLMDMTETVLTSVMAHEYLITNFGNLEGLTRLPITTIVEVAINIVLVMLVELFFAYRVYLLTRQIVLPILIALFGVAGLAAGICLVANISRSFEVSALASESMKIEVSLANAFEAISDLLATFALSIAFMKGRRHGLKSTTTMLNKLLGFTIARGGLVTVAQFLTLAFYVAWPTRLYWMPIHFVEGKLCVITMLVILNSRESLRSNAPTFIGRGGGDSAVSADSGRRQFQAAPRFQLHTRDERGKRTHGEMGGIHVERTVEYEMDKHGSV